MTNFDKELFIEWGKALASASVMFLLFCLLCVMCGCKTTEYVPVEHTALRTDTLYRAVWHTDSIINTDTIRIDGDVTEIIKWRIRTREVHDTVYQTKRDSVYIEKPYPVTEIKEVEKRLAWWQTGLMWMGGAFVALLGWLIYRKVRK